MADGGDIGDVQPPDLGAFSTRLASDFQEAFGVIEGGWVQGGIAGGALAVIGVLLRSVTRLANVLLRIFSTILEQDNPELGRAAVTVVGILFGHDVADNIPGDFISPGNLQASSAAVGAGILNAIFGPITEGTSDGLQPGFEGVEGYLGAITTFTVRGFVLDILEESIPHWHLSFVHHLEEGLISGLGLGRVARQALQPLVTVALQTPATWKAHLNFRPALLPEASAVRQFVTGQWDASQLDYELGRRGYSEDRIDALVNEHRKRLSPEQLFTLSEWTLIDPDSYQRRLIENGYDNDTANLLTMAMGATRQESLLRRQADVWLQKYEDGFINKDTFVQSLRILNLPPDILQLYVELGGARVETPRRLLSVAELKDAWNKNIITQNEFVNYVVRLGYSEEDATTLVLLNLATIRDKTEAAQAKKAAEDARAAQLAADKQQKADAAAAAKAAAQLARQAAAQQVAAQKAKIAQDRLALTALALSAAEQKQQLVDAQQLAGAVSADAATLAKDQIAAELVELLASISGQEAAAKASFDRQLLELRQADRQATIADELANVDLALEADRQQRSAAVAAKLHDVQALLALKLADLDDVYTARALTIDQDLADALAAIDTATVPTIDERRAVAAQRLAANDAALARRNTDIAAEFAARRLANDDALSNGLVKQAAHDVTRQRLDLAESQAIRLAAQQHDLSAVRLTEAGDQAEALTILEADRQKSTLQATAKKAHATLASEKLKAQLAARHAADAATITLTTIGQQVGPITDAEAARRRRTIETANASAERQETIVETEIAKGEASAQAAMQKASATVAAARQRLAAAQAAAPARQNAHAAASAQLEALTQRIDQQRLDLERQLAVDQAGMTVTPIAPTPPAQPSPQ